MSKRTFWIVNSLMILALVVWLGGLHLWAQDQPRHDKFSSDPAAFCYPGEERGSAHHCTCVMVCGPDATGAPVQMETTTCQLYCSKERCTCHAEEPCPGPEAL